MTNLIFSRTVNTETDILQSWIDTPSVNKWIYIDNWSEYYEAVSNSPKNFLYSVYSDSRLVAHIAAELIDSSAHISLIVDPCIQDKGIGTKVITEVISKANDLFGKITDITAIIYPSNIASKKCFTKCGFSEKGTDEDGGIIFVLPID